MNFTTLPVFAEEPFLRGRSLTKQMTTPSMTAMTPATRGHALTLVTLEMLPCGCVAGRYRARPTVVEVELLEAKGPNCLFYRHRTGAVTGLGTPDEWGMEGGEALV